MGLLYIVLFVIGIVLLVLSFNKTTCAICGKEMRSNRKEIRKKNNGEKIWVCLSCYHKADYYSINRENGTVKTATLADNEKRVRCNTCGHLYCYNAEDVARNQTNAQKALVDGVSASLNVLRGTTIGTKIDVASAQRHLDKIIDFSRCPKCNSSDIHVLSKQEYEAEKIRVANQTKNTSNISAADELKKFKELLDTGVITQEEFDAKKKQLLNF